MIFKYTSLAILAIYAFFVLTAWRKWINTPFFKLHKENNNENECNNTKTALVVCCRNEEEHLPLLYQSITQQTIQPDEIIFANDHSNDNTFDTITKLSENNQKMIVFNTIGEGKKNALREAIGKTTAELIICTDADCQLPNQHIENVVQHFQQHQPDLLLGGVMLSPTNTLFKKIQAIEFGSLIAAGAAAAFAKQPFLCNGANIAFKRSEWMNAKEHLNDKLKSGDDIFLLQYMKAQEKKIMFLKTADLVTTAPVENVSSFFNQRKRWASKTTAYTDKFSIFVACLVFLLSLMMVVACILSVFAFKQFATFTLFLFAMKFFVDSPLLNSFFNDTKQTELIRHIPLAALLYPFYIVLAACGALFGSFKWKENKKNN
ncbi:MAG: glycosyltransferase [Bacteroidales bacterium]|nr:glycosyltransferase [Bacteroidales bacterium]